MAKKESKFTIREAPATMEEEEAGIPLYNSAPTGLTIPKSFRIGETEINKQTLIAKRDEDVKNIINGVEDTVGYKKALKLRADYRTVRTALERYRKDLSKPHQEYVKLLKSATDELGAEALIGEEYFDGLMTEIDDEKQRIADEKGRQEQLRIQGRVNQIIALGAKFDGENYYFPYTEELAISALSVKEFTDGDFADFMVDVQAVYETEQQRIENERLQKEEEERKVQELADQVAQQAAANKLAQDALIAKQYKLRTKELALLGFHDDGGEFYMPNNTAIIISIWKDDIYGMNDQQWEDQIEQIENYAPPVEVEVAPDEYIDLINGEEVEIASGNPVSEPHESYVTNESLGEPTDAFSEVYVYWDTKTPFTDFEVTAKLKIRLYPDVFSEQALAGIKIGSQGKVQSLNWCLVK